MVRFFWRSCSFYLLLLSFFCCTGLMPDGFVADTLVRIPSGYACIQDLSVGDEVLVYDWLSQEGCFNGGILSETITHIISHEVATIVRLDVGDDVIEMAEDQLLFMPLQQGWIPACHIEAGQYLLGIPLHAELVHSVTVIKQPTRVYTFSLAHHHNYLVCSRNIVVHNFAQLGAIAFCATQAAEGGGFLAAFLVANPLVAPVTIGVGGVGLAGYGLWKLISGIKESKKSSKKDKGKNKGRSGQPEEPKEPKNNNSESEPTSVGAAAVALLKAIDESKQKAMEVFNRTCEWITTSENGLQAIRHAFENRLKHNFGPLLIRMGADLTDKNDVLRVGSRILVDVTQKLIAMGSQLRLKDDGVYYNILVEYGGELITTRGRIIDGIFKMSTMFIQPQHVR